MRYHLAYMSWLTRLSIIASGFGVGFAAKAIWYYLHWTSLRSAVCAGVLVALLSGLIWAAQDIASRFLRIGAAITLIGLTLNYGIYVYEILRVSDCGFIDGRLYCMNRYF